MDKESLLKLGLTEESAEKVLEETNNEIQTALEAERAKYADYEDVKDQLAKANEAIEGMKDYDQVKGEVEKYKAEMEASNKESQEKIRKLEIRSRVQEFTRNKKFINEITRETINQRLEEALSCADSQGRGMDELLEELTKDKGDVFAEENKPTPPVVPPMKGSDDGKGSVINKARSVMGLPVKE